MALTLCYFAWVREKIGCSEESISCDVSQLTIRELITLLCEKHEKYQSVFADLTAICVAKNQTFCDFETDIADGDEIAFFPPVTGGD